MKSLILVMGLFKIISLHPMILN